MSFVYPTPTRGSVDTGTPAFYNRALRADKEVLNKVLATGELEDSHTFDHPGLTDGVPEEERKMQIDHVVEIQLFCLWLEWAKLEGGDVSAGFLYELYHIVNGSDNLCRIPKHLNSFKGQVTKRGMFKEGVSWRQAYKSGLVKNDDRSLGMTEILYTYMEARQLCLRRMVSNLANILPGSKSQNARWRQLIINDLGKWVS